MTSQTGGTEAAPAKKRGRPPLPVGTRARDRRQFSIRLANVEALERFHALRQEHGLRAEELFAELVNLVPGDTLAYIVAVSDHQGVTPGALVERLIRQEWTARRYQWSRER